MKHFPLLIIAAMMVAVLPTPGQAATISAWATAVDSASNQLLYPTRALGEPDGSYADFLMKDAHVTLDFGQEVNSDLNLYMKILSLGAAVRVDFLNAERAKISSSSLIFNIDDTFVTLPFTGQETYRYAKIVSVEDEVWKLDAAEVIVDVVEDEMQKTETTQELTEEETTPEQQTSPVQGMLIKLPDDGNPNTHHDEAVYVVGADNMRHAFPSETVFFSWYENFDDVLIVDDYTMAQYPLGPNVTIRPGTYLVKITTDPKVYAVEPGGVLRWISSETLAEKLYGSDWAKRVRDVSDSFWSNYTVGDPIESAVHPSGTILVNSNGEVLYLSNGVYYSLPAGVNEYMRFNGDFHVMVSDEMLDIYIDGGELNEDPDIAYPF